MIENPCSIPMLLYRVASLTPHSSCLLVLSLRMSHCFKSSLILLFSCPTDYLRSCCLPATLLVFHLSMYMQSASLHTLIHAHTHSLSIIVTAYDVWKKRILVCQSIFQFTPIDLFQFLYFPLLQTILAKLLVSLAKL